MTEFFTSLFSNMTAIKFSLICGSIYLVFLFIKLLLNPAGRKNLFWFTVGVLAYVLAKIGIKGLRAMLNNR